MLAVLFAAPNPRRARRSSPRWRSASRPSLPLRVGAGSPRGGIALARERIRPEGFEALGAALALSCAGLFAVRDNLVRWAARNHHPPALLATAVSLAAAALLILGYLALFRRPNVAARLRTALPAK